MYNNRDKYKKAMQIKIHRAEAEAKTEINEVEVIDNLKLDENEFNETEINEVEVIDNLKLDENEK